ncbi:hypothetical protein KOR42_26890 [Thalassoglobus neptunius]|uniref:Uncharacterized protein n=1 Tax=Thalassoglobus neptunius TaxID=1938619 RepID=A0A5C5X044_9PLAN|nr:hypothetical protein [Thalassoglobus neptunius]TWT55562.1 hypothetical protein KOR42_26890 [Thalassoglobus neptunius]
MNHLLRIGCLGLLVDTIFTSAVIAHPGHGAVSSESTAHYLVEPVHGGWIVGLLMLVVGLALFFRKMSARKHARQYVRGAQHRRDRFPQ